MQLIQKQLLDIQKLIDDLKTESDTTLVLVEGRKDVKALQELGISKNIAQFKGRSLTELCDLSAKYKKIVICN